MQLIKEVVAAQPKTVIVLIHGGCIALPDETLASVPSLLDAFYPGELGGLAVVNALVGRYNPGGKLPYTNYFANFTQRDIRVTDLAADGGVTYRWFQHPVQFPFGVCYHDND